MTAFEPAGGATGQPWLELGTRDIPLTSPFNIGRSPKCRHVINNTTASREHTLLQFDEMERRWLLIDLGSTNGTYLNGQRIIAPVALRNGDRIGVGDQTLVFREPCLAQAPLDEPDGDVADQTVLAIARVPCWLLIADVRQSTQWIQKLSHEEWITHLRTWSGECAHIVQGSGGVINEYLGDGLLAFWRDGPALPATMVDVLNRFQALESASGMGFRVICHHGMVSFGAGMSSGREKLAGPELTFVFKIEKPAGQTGRKINLTQAAVVRLGSEAESVEIGECEVGGFAGTHKLYGLAGNAPGA